MDDVYLDDIDGNNGGAADGICNGCGCEIDPTCDYCAECMCEDDGDIW